MTYIVRMRNPKSGKIETYETQAESREDLQKGLDFWEQEAGYLIILAEERKCIVSDCCTCVGICSCCMGGNNDNNKEKQ